MARCEVCGNDYDKSFQTTATGQSPMFHSFEYAIQVLAPSCAHCNCRMIGHGMEARGAMFCIVDAGISWQHRIGDQENGHACTLS